MVPEDVHCFIIDEATLEDTEVEFTLTNSYTVTLAAPVPAGSKLRIRRITSKDAPLVDYAGGSMVSEDNLDKANQQAILAAAEAVDEARLTGFRLDNISLEIKGDKGDTGLSAYAIAVAAGFVGTEAEWVASLEGDKGDTGDTGPAWVLGPYTSLGTPAIPAGTDLVSTSGYSAAGDGGQATFAAASAEPALGPSFQDASGRWFALSERSPSSLQFGAGATGATPTENRVRLQEFFDYIAAGRYEKPRIEGSFTIDGGVSLVLGLTTTSEVMWSASLTATGTFDIMLTVNSIGRFNHIHGTVALNGGNQSAYALRTVQTGVSLQGASRLLADGWNLLYFKHTGISGLSGSNNSMTTLGDVYGAYIGSGSPLDATYSQSANWSARVDSGSNANNNQRSLITVDSLPDAYARSHLSPMFVIISGRAHWISAVDTTASTLSLYPWPDPALTSGTLTYLLGGLVSIDGSDNNIWGIDAIDASKVSQVLVSNGLYGPNVGRIQASGAGNVLTLGGSNSDAHDGITIGNFYVEGNGTFNVIRLTSATCKVNILNSQGVGETLSKYEVIAPWDTASSKRYSNIEHLESFTVRGSFGVHEQVKNLTNASDINVFLDRPAKRWQVHNRNGLPLRLQTPDASARKLFGYDVAVHSFVGTAANGAPTGSFTIDPPAGHTVNGGAVDANATFTGFKGPVTFLIYYDGGTAWTVYPVGGTVRGATVADPAAITSANAVNAVAAPTKAEFDALVAEHNKLRTDATAVRTQLVALLTSLKNAGVIS